MDINDRLDELINYLFAALPVGKNKYANEAMKHFAAIRKHIEEQDAVIDEIKSVVVDVSDINKLMWYDARKICRDVKVIIEKSEAENDKENFDESFDLFDTVKKHTEKVEATNKPEYKEGDEERIFDCAPGLTDGLSPRKYIDKVRGDK